MSIPGGFSSWDEYDGWLDSVLADGVHPDTGRGIPIAHPIPSSERAPARPRRSLEDEQRDEDFRVLTHPHNGWEQTGPSSLEKTDWAGTHHTMEVGDGQTHLRSVYPNGTAEHGEFDGLRHADDMAARRSINNVLLPLVGMQHGFDISDDGRSVVRRDGDGWSGKISPFKDHRGHSWFTYSGGNFGTGERSERDHPTLEAALEHANTRQYPGTPYRAVGAVSRAGDTIWR